MSGITLRGQIWHVHIRVPKTLQPILGATLIRYSTGTADRAVAEVQAAGVRLALMQIQQSQLRSKVMSANSKYLRQNMMSCVEQFDPEGRVTERNIVIDTGCPETDAKMAARLGFVSDNGTRVMNDSGFSVRDAVELFITDSEGKRKKTEKTKREQRSSLFLFVDLIEHIAGEGVMCSAIDRATAVKVRDALKMIPKNRSKVAKYRDKSLTEILTAGVPEADRIDETTVKKYLSRIHGFGAWCVVADHTSKNYFDKLIAGDRRRRASDERAVYDADELRLIFGVDGIGQAKQYSAYWLPFMALYTGGRLNELSQLRVEDFTAVEGLPCIQIDGRVKGEQDIDDGSNRTLKTPNCRRTIPLHPELVRLGLLDFVESRRLVVTDSVGGNLFDCSFSESNRFSKNSGTRFGVLLTALGIKQRGKSFHSLRHTFTDALKQVGVSEVVVAAMIGHEHGGITFSRYGKDFKPAVLIEALEKLSYDIEIAPMPEGLKLG